MRIILDTQAFLWLTINSNLLSKKAKQIFLDEDNDLFLSLASIWEITIKASLKKIKLTQSVEKFISNQLQENSINQLDIEFRHVTRVEKLPFHHRDPFDRLLISQALEENMPILSINKAFDFYDVKRIW